MKMRRMQLVGLALLSMLLTGCVRETTNGSAREFAYELWVAALAVVTGIGIVAAGWYGKGPSWRRWLVIVIGVLVAVLGAPSLLLSRIHVDENGFSRQSGILAMTTQQDVKYSDVRSMQLISRRSRRGRKTTYLVCTKKDGSSVEIGLGDALEQTAAPHILRGATQSGIHVVDQTDET